MGRTCSTNGSDEKRVQYLVGNLEGRVQSEDLDVDGRIISI